MFVSVLCGQSSGNAKVYDREMRTIKVNDTLFNKGCYFHVTGVFQIIYKPNN